MKRTGAEAIVAGLRAHGVRTVFSLPGVQTYGLSDALYRAQPELRTIGARHEQGCGYMALGYAQATGRPGVFAVVPGPGMLNASAALLTAYSRNAPVLCLTGQVPSADIGKGRGQLHEMPDQLATLRTLTKWSARISRPEDAPALVARAFHEMLSGRRGPVALEMPWDVFTQTAEVGECHPFKVAAVEPNDASVEAAAQLISEARAPMILIGSGAMDAGAEVQELAELLGAPVVPFRSGRGIVSDRHDLAMMHAAGFRMWPETDVAIGIGTRLEGAHWRWPKTDPPKRYVRIDIDPKEMSRFISEAAIVADAKLGVASLLKALDGRRLAAVDRRAAIREVKREVAREIRETLPQAAYLDVLREVLPDDGFVVDEVSQVGFTSWFTFPVYQPRTFLTSGYSGTLGAGFPMALGAKVAAGARPVVSITGDGGFLFAASELATAVQYNIGLVTLVFNNNAFLNVLRDQKALFEGRALGSELLNPDFVRFAESFGVAAQRVQTPQDFRLSLERALANHAPSLIEIVMERGAEASPWRYIHPTPHPAK